MNEPLPALRLLRDQVFGLYVVVPQAHVERVRERLIEIGAPFGLDAAGADRLRRPDAGVFVFGAGAGDALFCLKRAGLAHEIMPGWMLDAQSYGPPVDRLLLLGDKNPPFLEGESLAVTDDEAPQEDDLVPVDYRRLGLGREHLPELLRLATNPEWNHAMGDAPLHAVRAIAAVGGDEAPGALLRLLQETEGEDWDWLREEVKRALWGLAPDAIGPLADFAADETRGPLSRIAAVEAASRIARAHPEGRSETVARLTALLAQYAVQDTDLNGFLVAALVDLGAKEAAPVIERAFGAGRVNEMIDGDWEDAQVELGLKVRRERPRTANRLTELGRLLRAEMGVPEPLEDEYGNRLESAPAPLDLLASLAPPPAKVGRNDPCPCGSGKKFKKCCGA